MTIKKLLFIFVCTLAASTSHATVIDFETAATDVFTSAQTHQGFDWAFTAAGWFVGPHDTAFCPDCTSNGTSNLVAAGDRGEGTAQVVMTESGGGAFDIFSLDGATANVNEINQLLIEGTLMGGGSVSTYLDIDGVFDSYAIAGFTNLVSVTFSSVNSGGYNLGGFSIDNIDLTGSVPEPGILALLSMGLLSLGLTRRRTKK